MKTLLCYVHVSGDATNAEDEGVQGVYEIALTLKQEIELDSISELQASIFAKEALDCFHNKQGIEDLDDFEITVYLEDGRMITELDDDLVSHAVMNGQVDTSTLSFKV